MPRAKSLKDQVTELSFTGDAKAIQQKLDELGELTKTLSTALKLRFPMAAKASTGGTGAPRARNLGGSTRKRQPQGTGAQGTGATATITEVRGDIGDASDATQQVNSANAG